MMMTFEVSLPLKPGNEVKLEEHTSIRTYVL